MKLYGKKFVQQAIKKQTKAVQETRDGIIWAIQVDAKTCWVRIQGSNENIVSHFPRNWRTRPYWLKVGNAVRILHRGGTRGYVEVIGEGRAIPTALSGQSMPDEQELVDGIVTGCTMTAIESSMGVMIEIGTYRIDGELYGLNIADDYILYDLEDYVLYDSEQYQFFLPDSGDPGMTRTLDPAPSVGYFRYDAFCVGSDGVIDYVKGDSSSTPEKPDLLADHVLLGSYILVVGGATFIEEKDIGRIWTTPYPANLYIDIDGGGSIYDMEFEEGETTVAIDIVLRLKDQYENNYSGEFTGSLTRHSGDGVFSDSTLSFTGSKTVTFTRDQTMLVVDQVVFVVDGVSDGQNLTSIGIINPQELVLE